MIAAEPVLPPAALKTSIIQRWLKSGALLGTAHGFKFLVRTGLLHQNRA
jgi:hypothetical protein